MGNNLEATIGCCGPSDLPPGIQVALLHVGKTQAQVKQAMALP